MGYVANVEDDSPDTDDDTKVNAAPDEEVDSATEESMLYKFSNA